MKNHLILPIFLIGASLSVACVPQKTSGSNSYGETMSQQVARHDQQIQQMLSQMGQVEQVLPGQAEVWSQMQTMRQELNQVHGQLDDVNNQMSGAGSGEIFVLKEKVARIEIILRRMASQFAISTDELDAPMPAAVTPNMGQTGAVPMAGTPTNPEIPTAPTDPTTVGVPVIVGGNQPVTPPVVATPQGSDIATNLYQSGIKFFDQRKYKEAIVAFKDFSTTYPQHNLAGNSHFWQGESYFQLQDYARAALAYQEVITKYPGSHQMPAAMLKQGISLYKVNKKPAGKERLEELIKKYPTSPEASRAKKYIQEN